MSAFINGRGKLGVVPAFDEPNGLILKSSDGTLASLVDLIESTVDEALLAFRLSCQASKNFGPGVGIHPTKPKGVYSVPTSLMPRKCPPSTFLSQEVMDCQEPWSAKSGCLPTFFGSPVFQKCERTDFS